jgi:hypothetical protein
MVPGEEAVPDLKGEWVHQDSSAHEWSGMEWSGGDQALVAQSHLSEPPKQMSYRLWARFLPARNLKVEK